MTQATAFAPGRVEILGNHTDYNDGLVLSAALPQGVTVHGCKEAGQSIRLSSEVSAEPKELLTGNPRPQGDWTDYVVGVWAQLREAGCPVGAFSAQYASNLPMGAGLSSSAAIEVATAVLLSRLFDFTLPPLEIARLCRRAENLFVGVNCGLLDQATSVFGKKDHVMLLDCRAESVSYFPFPSRGALLVVHSEVKHELTGGEYNERRESCLAAARALGVPALRDATSAMVKAAGLEKMTEKRALHVTGEIERVTAALSMLEHGDIAAFGRLMTESHQSSRQNFENSTPELDLLVEIATALPGVYGARLTGGGFGGAIIALVERDRITELSEKIAAEYRQKTGLTPRTIPVEPADGAMLRTS